MPAGLEERDGGWWPRFDRDVMVAALAENVRRSFWDEWRSITCPTLVVLGRSGIIPAHEAEAMLRQRPGTVALSVPEAGHDVHLEHPEVLQRVFQKFLRGSGGEG
ncbi:alpha/beta hydrolase [Streptomyces sp. NPDC096046]|uniref:alpha/beta fold hydrolase n=1 Tax=Streptomyces sp. NPDC096046 TaxID=3155542 RepID=UPI0033326437